MLAALLEGIKAHKHNSEKFLVFAMVILQKQKHVRGSKAICSLLTQRLNNWDNGNFQMLVDSTEAAMKAMLSFKWGNATAADRLDTFQHLMQQGEIRKAVTFLSEREETSGILDPQHTDDCSGLTTMEILETKHPKPNNTLSPANLPSDDKVPSCPPVAVSPEIVADVAQKLRGAVGLGGTDGPTPKGWLLRYKTVSKFLRASVASFTEWLSTGNGPWVAIRALMSDRLIALDNDPGVRPIGIGQIWRRLLAKTVVAMTGHLATTACGADQLCCGLKAGIEGGIHAMAQLWKHMADEPDFGILMLDAKNAFNEA